MVGFTQQGREVSPMAKAQNIIFAVGVVAVWLALFGVVVARTLGP